MNRAVWRWVVGGTAVVAVVVPAAMAWACVGLMSLTVNTPSVPPGGSVTVTGREFAQGAPVEIHLDSVTGPVLATAPPPKDTMTSKFDVKVTIPSSVTPGQHVLVATQAYHYMNSGAPARAVVYVGAAAPAPAGPAPRPADLEFDPGPSAASLVLIGLAVAAVGLVAAGSWSLAAARRRPAPSAVPGA